METSIIFHNTILVLNLILVKRYSFCSFGSSPGVIMGFEVEKAAMGQVFSEYFGFPCQSFH
jgi:hypothetical protein